MRQVPENRKAVGLTYFVTSRVEGCGSVFSDEPACKIVVDSLQFYRQRGDIELYGFVIMPDHIHLIIKMGDDLTLEWWMNRFKSFVAHSLGRGPIWQKGYWSEVMTSVSLLEQKLTYIHENPVRGGLAERAEDYKWSSARDMLTDTQRKSTDRFV
jgi:putative transposase